MYLHSWKYVFPYFVPLFFSAIWSPFPACFYPTLLRDSFLQVCHEISMKQTHTHIANVCVLHLCVFLCVSSFFCFLCYVCVQHMHNIWSVFKRALYSLWLELLLALSHSCMIKINPGTCGRAIRPFKHQAWIFWVYFNFLCVCVPRCI